LFETEGADMSIRESVVHSEIAQASRMQGVWLSTTEKQETSRILLVGEDNPQSAYPEHALIDHPVNCAGWRLRAKIFGLRRDVYCALWRRNLCAAGWDSVEARCTTAALLNHSSPWSIIVCLGKKVCDKFGVEQWSFTEVVFDHKPGEVRFMLVGMPHPSGRCREWNDPGAAERVKAMMRKVSPFLPWGGVCE
jgi:hypothetical protein